MENNSFIGKDFTLRYFLADSVIDQGNGKTTLIGLYPDNQVVLENPQKTPSNESPAIIHSLAFLISISGMKGDTVVSFTLRDPNDVVMVEGSPFTNEPTSRFKNTEPSFNTILSFQPFIIATYGEYKLKIKVNDIEMILPFKVIGGVAEGIEDAA